MHEELWSDFQQVQVIFRSSKASRLNLRLTYLLPKVNKGLIPNDNG